MEGTAVPICIDLLDSDSDDNNTSITPRKKSSTKRSARKDLPTRKSKRQRTAKVDYYDNDDDDDDEEQDDVILLSSSSDDDFSDDGIITSPPPKRNLRSRTCKKEYDDIHDSNKENNKISSNDDYDSPAMISYGSIANNNNIEKKKKGTAKCKNERTTLGTLSQNQPSKASAYTTKKSATGKNNSSSSSSSYLKILRANVKKRIFPLSQIAKQQKVTTGRTIKKMKAWKGFWPSLREFMQNTIDHLNLIDSKTGRRRDCIDLVVSKNENELFTAFAFVCEGQEICKIQVSRDELIIDQLYTYPIASRALDTGVPDEDKFSFNSNSQAGGFGDGFKTATVALIANTKKSEFDSLQWFFYTFNEKKRIEWNFEGLTREKIATFAKCEVLQVNIEKNDMDMDEWNQLFKSHIDKGKENRKVKNDGKDYIMRQVIKVKGIGKAFIEQTIPRLVVFWDLNEESLISTHSRGGDFLGPASTQPPLYNNMLSIPLRPESGIYVRGIWVRSAKITDTIMCFYGNRLEVTGRDRNDVDEEELVLAIGYVIERCDDIQYLRRLLEPLRGQMELNPDNSSGKNIKLPARKQRNQVGVELKNNSSWLLRSPRFFNRVIEIYKDFILQEVFQIPNGAIFISSKTTNNKNPFINWAASFLQRNGAPLISIEKGANKILFEEVNEYELTDRCVQIVKRKMKERGKSEKTNNLQPFIHKLLTFMGIGRARVFFSPEVSVAFVHNSNVFIPEGNLTREIIVRVLNVCNSYLDGTKTENYSCLMQAIFETLPNTMNSNTPIQLADATKVVDRAKCVLKETQKFLSCPSEGKEKNAEKMKSTQKNPSLDNTVSNSQDVRNRSKNSRTVDLTLDNESVNMNIDLEEPLETEGSTIRDDLEQQIRRISQIASKQNENNIIPEADFGNDEAGNNDCCLRPSSSLQKVTFSGGSLYCDNTTAAEIEGGKWKSTLKNSKVVILQDILKEACNIVCSSIPSLRVLIKRVYAGYDGKNNTYEGFCDGQRIIINFFAYLPKLKLENKSASLYNNTVAQLSSQRALVHDFVVTVTHELAHFLEPKGGHGPIWRDTHSRMLIKVMKSLEEKNQK